MRRFFLTYLQTICTQPVACGYKGKFTIAGLYILLAVTIDHQFFTALPPHNPNWEIFLFSATPPFLFVFQTPNQSINSFHLLHSNRFVVCPSFHDGMR